MDPFKNLLNNAKAFEDDRGYLKVLYESDRVILKRSYSKKGVFRGMHFQKDPFLQTKLIRVVEGRIIDFVFDASSDCNEVLHQEITPTLEWIEISSNYAHGFYACEDTVFEYICDGSYNENAEAAFSIVEFLQTQMKLGEIKLSEKDMMAKPLKFKDKG